MRSARGAIIISAGRIVSDGTPGELHARADGHNAVTLALEGVDPAVAKEALAAVNGVRAVEEVARDGDDIDGSDGKALRLRVLPAAGGAIVGEVGRVARSQGWTVDEMTVDRGRLEDVFRAITAPDRTRS